MEPSRQRGRYCLTLTWLRRWSLGLSLRPWRLSLRPRVARDGESVRGVSVGRSYT